MKESTTSNVNVKIYTLEKQEDFLSFHQEERQIIPPKRNQIINGWSQGIMSTEEQEEKIYNFTL